MGYSTTINYKTGREVYVCDFCGNGDGTGKKIQCPYGYCPKPIACADCRSAKKHLHNAEQRAHCKKMHEEYEATRKLEAENAHNVVRAAWGSWATGIEGVTLVKTGDDKHYLVKGYEVRRPNWLDANEVIGHIANEFAEALLTQAYKGSD